MFACSELSKAMTSARVDIAEDVVFVHVETKSGSSSEVRKQWFVIFDEHFRRSWLTVSDR